MGQSMMKLSGMLFIVIFFISTSPVYAGGYAKPDQWGNFNGKDETTGERITAKPDDWGGYRVQKRDHQIQMKPDKWGGYDCKVYDKNYKQVDSSKLKPDGYGGYRSDEKNIRVKNDKYGVYKW